MRRLVKNSKKILEIEEYNLEKVLEFCKGFWDDPLIVIECIPYGYIHDTGFYVVIRDATQTEINNEWDGISKELFKIEFNKKLKEVKERWDYDTDFGYY